MFFEVISVALAGGVPLRHAFGDIFACGRFEAHRWGKVRFRVSIEPIALSHSGSLGLGGEIRQGSKSGCPSPTRFVTPAKEPNVCSVIQLHTSVLIPRSLHLSSDWGDRGWPNNSSLELTQASSEEARKRQTLPIFRPGISRLAAISRTVTGCNLRICAASCASIRGSICAMFCSSAAKATSDLKDSPVPRTFKTGTTGFVFRPATWHRGQATRRRDSVCLAMERCRCQEVKNSTSTKFEQALRTSEKRDDGSPLSRRPGRPMSGPHVFGLQNRTADGVSTITSRLDERFPYRQYLESLERVPAAQGTGR